MRIDFLLPDFRGGGVQKMIVNMANELATRGHNIRLVVLQEIGPYKDKVGSSVNVKVLNKQRTLWAIADIAKEIRQSRPQIIYAAMSYMNIAAILARLLSGASCTKLVISERNHFSLNGRNGRPPSIWQKLCIALLYPIADSIVGISKGVADDIACHLFFGKNKVRMIYNPVVTKDMVNFVQGLPSNTKESYPVIITSGRLVPQKDQKMLLHAFAELRHEYPDAKLIILGEGPLQEELKALCCRLNMKEHVIFQGFVPDPLSFMNKADLFVISSAWEGFCNVIVEALLCGLPVVSTNCPSGPAEILENGMYGKLVPVDDTDAMAQAMAKALKEPHNAKKQMCRAMDFSVTKICDAYEGLFYEIAGRRSS